MKVSRKLCIFMLPWFALYYGRFHTASPITRHGLSSIRCSLQVKNLEHFYNRVLRQGVPLSMHLVQGGLHARRQEHTVTFDWHSYNLWSVLCRTHREGMKRRFIVLHLIVDFQKCQKIWKIRYAKNEPTDFDRLSFNTDGTLQPDALPISSPQHKYNFEKVSTHKKVSMHMEKYVLKKVDFVSNHLKT